MAAFVVGRQHWHAAQRSKQERAGRIFSGTESRSSCIASDATTLGALCVTFFQTGLIRAAEQTMAETMVLPDQSWAGMCAVQLLYKSQTLPVFIVMVGSSRH